MSEKSYQDVNVETISRWIEDGWEWGRPISHEEYLRAKTGDWQILLTPTKPVPRTWFPPLAGARVLGLASGGGQQMPILTAAGARCTVLDYTPAQLDAERLVAGREGYGIEVVHADMRIKAHRPFGSIDDVLDLNKDITSDDDRFWVEPRPLTIGDTDTGADIRGQIADLRDLLDAYRTGELAENGI